MDSLNLVDSLTKEVTDQRKKKRELTLLQHKTDLIEKQKNNRKKITFIYFSSFLKKNQYSN